MELADFTASRALLSRKEIHFIVSGSFKDPLSCDCNGAIGAMDLQCWRLVHERHEGQFADHSETRRLLPRHEGFLIQRCLTRNA